MSRFILGDCTTGEHFGDGFGFNIAQTTGVEERGPALVSRKELFERTRGKTGQHETD